MKKIIIILLATSITLSSLTLSYFYFHKEKKLDIKEKIKEEKENEEENEEEERKEESSEDSKKKSIVIKIILFLIIIIVIVIIAVVIIKYSNCPNLKNKKKSNKTNLKNKKEIEKNNNKIHKILQDLFMNNEDCNFLKRIVNYYLKKRKKNNEFKFFFENEREIIKERYYLFDDEKITEKINELKTPIPQNNDYENYTILEKIGKKSDFSILYNDDQYKEIDLNINFFLFSFISIKNLVFENKEDKILIQHNRKKALYDISFKYKNYFYRNYFYYVENLSKINDPNIEEEEEVELITEVILRIFFYWLNKKFDHLSQDDIEKLFPKNKIDLAAGKFGFSSIKTVYINFLEIFNSMDKI